MTSVSGADLDGRPSPTPTQHAIRLLTLMNTCGEPVTAGDPYDAVSAIRSELRLQAMDFWLRNPDYLADELVNLVLADQLPTQFLNKARSLVDDAEPDLRWYPMPRWLYGAYEALDDAFSVLETYGLATLRRTGTPGQKSQRNQFYLTQAGQGAALQLAEDPVLCWYPRQAELVRLVAGDDVGDQLKDRQYLQATYAQTELRSKIAPIAPLVRGRLRALAEAESRHSPVDAARAGDAV